MANKMVKIRCLGLQRFLRLGLCWASLAFAHTLYAQPKATATLKPERVETGDTFQLYIIVSGASAKPTRVDFVSWSDAFPLENMLAKSDWRKSGAQWIQHFTLISFDSAQLELPPLTVLQSSGEALITNQLSLQVFPTRGTEMATMRDIHREPQNWTDYLEWAGLALGLVLLFWWWRARIKKPAVVPQVATVAAPTLSAADLALQKLDKLQTQQHWKKGLEKEHYAQLSLVLREYLENTHQIAALESTTRETTELLRSKNLSDNYLKVLQELLLAADLVKYAQSKPDSSQCEASITKARGLILSKQGQENTRKEPPSNRNSAVNQAPL
jgi:hypothetical protein